MTESEDYRLVREMRNLCRTDPYRYMEMANQRINANPSSAEGYFDRHFAWMRLDQPMRALEDLDKVIDLEPDPFNFFVRGCIHRRVGDFEKALADFEFGETMDPDEWDGHVLGHFYQADCHARLGHEMEALAYCARLPEEFWTPGPHDSPPGNKAEIAEELRRIAAAARNRQK